MAAACVSLAGGAVAAADPGADAARAAQADNARPAVRTAQADNAPAALRAAQDPAAPTAARLRRQLDAAVARRESLRPVYEQAKGRPFAGAQLLRSEIESLRCFVDLRAQQQVEPGPLKVDSSTDSGRAFHAALDRGRAVCAGLQPQEFEAVQTIRREASPDAAAADPLLRAVRTLMQKPDAAQRRQALRAYFESGAPFDQRLLTLLLMRYDPQESRSSFYFDGRRYRVLPPDGVQKLSGSSDLLMAAMYLAACEMGASCARDGLRALGHCLERPVDCAQPDVQSMVRSALKEGAYVDLQAGLQGLGPLSARLVAAIRRADARAFLDRSER